MDLRLRGKVAMVSGASKGIGKAIALGLAEEGVHLALNARGPEALEKLADEIRRQHEVEVLAVPGDMTRAPSASVGSTSWSTTPAAPRAACSGTSPSGSGSTAGG